MISFDKIYGNIDIINNDESYIVILDNYVGSINVGNDCLYLTFILYNESKVLSDIVLSEDINKLDTIKIQGQGYCEFQTLKATSIEIISDIKLKHIEGNVIRLNHCQVDGTLQETIIDDPVDKTDLANLLSTLDASFDIDEYQVSVNGADVLTTDVWITPEMHDGYVDAYAHATNVNANDSATQSAVNEAYDNLVLAYSNITLRYGKMRIIDKTSLHDAIISAGTFLAQYDESDTGYDIPSDTYYIPSIAYQTLTNKLNNCNQIYEDTTVTQNTVDNAADELNYYINNTIPVKGKQIEFEYPSSAELDALFEAIEEVNLVIDGDPEDEEYSGPIYSSDDGSDVRSDSMWVTTFTFNNLIDVFDKAVEMYEKSTDPYSEIKYSKYSVIHITNAIYVAINGLNRQWGTVPASVRSLQLPDINISGSKGKFSNTYKLGDKSRNNSFDTSIFIQAKGHVWLIDCYVVDTEHNISIQSPYILLDNAKCSIQAETEALDTKIDKEYYNEISTENCKDVEQTITSFSCNGIVTDENNIPKEFLYVIVKDENDKYAGVISREKLYASQPAHLVTPYDKFKHSTEYTNVDLHRWINQDGEVYKGYGTNYILDDIIKSICNDLWHGVSVDWEAIPDEVIQEICNLIYTYEPHNHTSVPLDDETIEEILNDEYDFSIYNGYDLDEIDSRKYELNIINLNSYRTTELSFYEDNSEIVDERELP